MSGRNRGRGRGEAVGVLLAKGSYTRKDYSFKENNEKTRLSEAERAIKFDQIDEKLGFSRHLEQHERLGWLVNMQPTLICDSEFPEGRSGVDLYFINEEDEYFKSTFFYKPYFMIICKEGSHAEIEENLLRRFPNTIDAIEKLTKEDLSLPNHLGGNQRKVMKLVFQNSSDLLTVRKFIQPLASKNENDKNAKDAYANALLSLQGKDTLQPTNENDASYNVWSNIIGIREYDVPYLVRAAIDIDLRVGLWYTVRPNKESINDLIIQHRPDLVKRADPVVLAFDIETTKLPLKFPDASFDMVMMISLHGEMAKATSSRTARLFQQISLTLSTHPSRISRGISLFSMNPTRKRRSSASLVTSENCDRQ
ncbi:DNA polymerase epsilon catalytic subunit [Entomophthora muscae]|uniref:DNA polymerase epsilon catalytic subunit n=1 Tax=Entomophthora muscae TaxID=34485 RepID=A0ACC2US18_9FUNG|nr:DNA polymerase epsilon catalytic subunit [Entomophthora muscae]